MKLKRIITEASQICASNNETNEDHIIFRGTYAQSSAELKRLYRQNAAAEWLSEDAFKIVEGEAGETTIAILTGDDMRESEIDECSYCY